MITTRTGSSLLSRLLKAALSPIIFIGALELGARMVDPRPGFFLLPSDGNCLQRSSLLLMEFEPNCTGDLRGTWTRTNSLGLRGRDVRDDGSRRILALGDSCTWGFGVSEEESYPEVLQQLLDQRADGRRYQVINAGVPGYTSYQGLVLFRERLVAMRPAVVIIGYGFNDTFTAGDVEVQLARTRRLMPLVRLDDALLLNSTLYRWLRWKMRHAAEERESVRVSPEKYGTNLEQLISLARAGDAKVMMLSFTVPGGGQQDYLRELKDVSAAMAVPLVTYQGPRLDVVHPTAEGYRRFAAVVLGRLENEGYLQ